MKSKKILRAVLLAICLHSACSIAAQTKYDVPENVIKLSYGPAVVTSNVYSDKGIYGNLSAMNLELEYSHFWQNRWGLGVQVLQSHFDIDDEADCMNLFYAGPSVSCSYGTDKNWLWHITASAGYANWDDRGESHSGIGTTMKLGVDYMIGRHIGVGAEATSLMSWFKKPKNWHELHHDESFGVRQKGLSINLKIFL